MNECLEAIRKSECGKFMPAYIVKAKGKAFPVCQNRFPARRTAILYSWVLPRIKISIDRFEIAIACRQTCRTLNGQDETYLPNKMEQDALCPLFYCSC
jgi:hypothetical protein